MDKNNNNEKLTKVGINWEITCYDKTSTNTYFIRSFG